MSKQGTIGLGAAGLSLVLWSAVAAQQGGEAADAAEVERTLELQSVEQVQIESLEEEGVVVAQDDDQLRRRQEELANRQEELRRRQEEMARRQEEMLRQILKELTQDGNLTDAEAREMLGLEPRAVDEGPAIEETGEVISATADGASLYLPLGTTQTFAAEAGSTLELPFVADGPGILTVAYSGGGGRLRIAVTDAEGNGVRGESSRGTHNHRGSSPVEDVLVPLSAAGEYTVRVTVRSNDEVKLGAEWIPFPQVQSQRVEIEAQPEPVPDPEPDPETEVTLVPDRMVVGSIDQSAPETTHLWCRFDAEEDGQLVVLANASQGDITMQTFDAGRFNRMLDYSDNDLNGSVANEGIILDVRAGQTHYVRVDMISGQRCDVELRTGWVPLAEDDGE